MTQPPEVKIPEIFSFTKTYHHKPYAALSQALSSFPASGKNVVVTGGGTGIGKAIAIAFAQANAASVSILGRREDRLKSSVEAISAACTSTEPRGTLVRYEIADLTNRADVESALQNITAKAGKIDVFVSNAGAAPTPKPVMDFETDEFMHAFDINVRSALNAVQVFFPLAAPGATLLNISTAAAHVAPMPGSSGYVASKAANLKLMDYVATENPQLHVVNIQPGIVRTEANQSSPEEILDDAELSGQFCVWLTSPEAAFLKSKFVWANWDIDELKQRAEEIKSSRLFTWVLDGVPM